MASHSCQNHNLICDIPCQNGMLHCTCMYNIKIACRMSKLSGALNVEYQNGISHIKMEILHEFDAITICKHACSERDY